MRLCRAKLEGFHFSSPLGTYPQWHLYVFFSEENFEASGVAEDDWGVNFNADDGIEDLGGGNGPAVGITDDDGAGGFNCRNSFVEGFGLE